MKVLLITSDKLEEEKWNSIVTELGYEVVLLEVASKKERLTSTCLSALADALFKAKFYHLKTGLPVIAISSKTYLNGVTAEDQILTTENFFKSFVDEETGVVVEESIVIASEKETFTRTYNKLNSDKEVQVDFMAKNLSYLRTLKKTT